MENSFRVIVMVILFFLTSCKKNEFKSHRLLKEDKTVNPLEKKLYSKINMFIDSSNCRKNKVISIRYQRFKKKDFIQVSSDGFFIPDSLYVLKEYKNYLVAIYNKDFFDNIIEPVKMDSLMIKNNQWNIYKRNQMETGIPCFDMYELVNGKLVKVSINSYYYNNLFADPPMLPPPPPPSKKNILPK
ncbi:hypothetical protein [Chryseobacterium camelliae]|uniref:hypothetical protein n=1 Tax=Chryseobacterium camelliae TaxID=1265445 RepID=UPI0028634BB3|nr:hypothetical protein [Chryseobacterium camelliae]MDR6514250.1 hypothetical protein [Chryseobacterium camelliae]